MAKHASMAGQERTGVVVPLRRSQPPEVTDRELVERACDGSQQAKEQLYRRHARMAFGMTHRLLADPAEADDVVQDAFLLAFERLSSLRDGQAFAAWLGSIVVRCVRRRIRKRTLWRRLGLAAYQPIETDTLISGEASPSVRAELTALFAILDELPANARIALVLRRVEGLTMPEIASHMDVSLSTAKRHFQTAEVLLEARLSRPRST